MLKIPIWIIEKILTFYCCYHSVDFYMIQIILQTGNLSGFIVNDTFWSSIVILVNGDQWKCQHFNKKVRKLREPICLLKLTFSDSRKGLQRTFRVVFHYQLSAILLEIMRNSILMVIHLNNMQTHGALK